MEGRGLSFLLDSIGKYTKPQINTGEHREKTSFGFKRFKKFGHKTSQNFSKFYN